MRITLALFALLAGLSGCDVEFESNGDFISPEGTAGIPPGGTVGATPGGAQDIGYVRQTIETGRVPLGDDWLVEGLLSEHDFPVAGADCDDLLCIRPGLGKALDPHTGETNWWVHLGMTTGIAVESFQRPPMDLVVLIDTSAAMAIDQAETNEAVTRLLPHLTMADRLAVVTFDDDVHVLHPLQTVAEPDALARQVTALTAQGGWHFNAGLAAALDQFQGPPDPTRMRRIIIMSCDYPNPDGAFAEQVTQAEDAAIGLSIFGVLLARPPPRSGPYAGRYARRRVRVSPRFGRNGTGLRRRV